MDGKGGVRWYLYRLAEIGSVMRNLKVMMMEDEADGEDANGLEDESMQEEEEGRGGDDAPLLVAEPLEEPFTDSLGGDPCQCSCEYLVNVQAMRVRRVLDGPSKHGDKDEYKEDEEGHGEVQEEVGEAEGGVRGERLGRSASDKVG